MPHLNKILLLLLCLPFTLQAHGPTPQKGKETIIINAPVDKVWDSLKQFDAISTWHPDVKSSKGDGKNAADGIRTVTLQNDEQFVDSLDFYSEKDHEYSYRLKTENTKALPVSSYTNSIQVTQGETPNTSVVSIKSRFYRGDTSNTPPDALNDAAAVAAMEKFFKHGLDGLKAKVEK